MMFDRMYKNSLEKAAEGVIDTLDGEAMLDDFEYTLIRPYVSENEAEIKHKPYVGMADRITRLEYLGQLTKEAPSNPVDLYTEKYKSGELSLQQMRLLAKSALDLENPQREQCVEVAGYVQALEKTNKSRSMLWRCCHPIKNSSEQKDAERMKQMLIETVDGDTNAYEEIAKTAYERFEGYNKADARLAVNMANAREEMNRAQKMNDAIRESSFVEGIDRTPVYEQASRIERSTPVRDWQKTK
jgi:hypothetical protein